MDVDVALLAQGIDVAVFMLLIEDDELLVEEFEKRIKFELSDDLCVVALIDFAGLVIVGGSNSFGFGGKIATAVRFFGIIAILAG
jgi:hypothetical protein